MDWAAAGRRLGAMQPLLGCRHRARLTSRGVVSLPARGKWRLGFRCRTWFRGISRGIAAAAGFGLVDRRSLVQRLPPPLLAHLPVPAAPAHVVLARIEGFALDRAVHVRYQAQKAIDVSRGSDCRQLLVVRPETLVGWHKAIVRWHWRILSRRRPGRPPQIALVRGPWSRPD